MHARPNAAKYARPLMFPSTEIVEADVYAWDELHDRVLQLGAQCQRLEAKNRELKDLAAETRAELLLRMTELKRYEDFRREGPTAQTPAATPSARQRCAAVYSA